MARTAAGTRSAATGTNLSGCLNLNGRDNYVTVTDNAAYSIGTTGAITISLWLNPLSTTMPKQEGSGYVYMLSKLGASKNEWAFRMYQDYNTEGRYNRISFYTFNSAGGLGDGVATQETVKVGEWMHLVATVDSSKVMRLYKNGVLKDVFTSTMTFSDTDSNMTIGAGGGNSDTLASFWQGGIDDVRIYNRVLPPTEVSDLFRSNRELTNGLVGWWKFDEASGTTATDSSVTANNGTLNGGTRISGMQRRRVPLITAERWVSSSFPDEPVVVPGGRRTVRSLGTHALKFNGTTSLATNTYVLGAGSFSVGMWIRFDRFVVNDRVIDAQITGPADGFTLIVGAANSLSFTIRNSTTNVASISNVDDLQAGRWHHIVCTYEVNSVKYYLDGVIQSRDTSATMTASAAVFTVGRRSPSSSNFLNGAIDQMLFYERVLTPVEVEGLYFDGFVPDGGAIIYNFDNAATDSSRNAYTLTLSNTSYITDTAMTTRTAVT